MEDSSSDDDDSSSSADEDDVIDDSDDYSLESSYDEEVAEQHELENEYVKQA